MYNFGRKQIFTSLEPTEANIPTILSNAIPIFSENASDSEYLYDYYKGDQPILDREKLIRPEINNKIVENHAIEIVTFKKSYIFGDPVQYVKRSNDYVGKNSDPKDIAALNQLMDEAFKATSDEELGEWILTAGAGYRAILDDKTGERPYFVIDTLTPMEAFVVYSNGIGKKPILCGKFTVIEDAEGNERAQLGVYTRDLYVEYEYDYNGITFPTLDELSGGQVKYTASINGMKRLPIIEYPSNPTRQGSFEIVLTMLDALNTLSSDRVNGVEQFIQSFLVFLNCEISDEDILKIPKLGAIKVKFQQGAPGDIKYIVEQLNQGEVQTLVDYTYKKVLEICQMPDRAMSTGGNTGMSMEIGQGWIAADNWAKSFGNIFDRPEKRFLDAALYILTTVKKMPSGMDFTDIDISEIEVKFTRNKLANLMVKTQAGMNLRELGVHPRIVYERIGVFDDPENAYIESMPYIDKVWYRGQATSTTLQGENLSNTDNNNTGENPSNTGGNNGQSDNASGNDG